MKNMWKALASVAMASALVIAPLAMGGASATGGEPNEGVCTGTHLSPTADGDLTTSATVTGAYTGATADAINYTIDQLRVLVSSINQTSRNVSQAAEDTQATALHLAEAAEHQAQDIAVAASATTEMAMTIDQVASRVAHAVASFATRRTAPSIG